MHSKQSNLCTNSDRREILRQPSNKDSLWCTHCKKPRYKKEMCWNLEVTWETSLDRNGGNWNQQQFEHQGGQPNITHFEEKPNHENSDSLEFVGLKKGRD